LSVRAIRVAVIGLPALLIALGSFRQAARTRGRKLSFG
jgi:hypothetical protein